MKLTERLGKEWIFFDGGMGTILQEHGLKAGELPETWNLSHPDEIIALNRSYFEAGCDVVNTNTFGANALKYPDNLQEIVQAAVSHAKTARQQAGREDAYIALDIGPTGKLLQPIENGLPIKFTTGLHTGRWAICRLNGRSSCSEKPFASVRRRAQTSCSSKP